MLEFVKVFDAAQLGYITTRIPALVTTRQGTVLAFCEARRGMDDWSAIDIFVNRSADGGLTWEGGELLLTGGGRLASNATPIADRDGTVHFLFQRNYERAFYMRSEDDGVTWTEPQDITYAFEAFRPEYNWQVLAPGPGHSVQLGSGRLLAPVWLCDPATPGVAPGDHRPSCVVTVYSDDGGETWERGEIVLDSAPAHLNPSETVAAELSDGRVMLNIRSESPQHRRLVTTSQDGIRGWSEPVFDDALYEPVCMASLIALPDPKDSDRQLLVFVNPDSRHEPGERLPAIHFSARENLVAKLSYDEGVTWPVAKLIDPGMASYSDLAVTADRTMLCLYEAGTLEGAMGKTTHLNLARFDLEWLTDIQR